MEMSKNKIISHQSIKDAVILFGGEGTRMRPFSLFNPKCLYPFKKKKIIDHVIDETFNQGVKDIYLCVNAKNADLIKEHLSESNLDYFDDKLILEEEPTGTAGWLKWVRPFKDTFLVLNGDDLLDIDVTEALVEHKKSGALITIITTNKENTTDSGNIDTDNPNYFGKVKSFEEKPEVDTNKLVSTGWYIMEPEVKDLLCKIKKDYIMFETDVFPKVLELGKLYHYPTKGQWFPLGKLEEIRKAKNEWRKHK